MEKGGGVIINPQPMPPLTPESILKQTFGYEEFKPLQREVIRNVLDGRDTMAVMPTGGGKSLCYQIPALIFPGLTVVVSPLIALMKDQVEQLTQLGVPALFLNSSLSYEEYEANMARVVNGKVKLLYVAPETLLTSRLYGLLSTVTLDCLTIDEAHCISEWGHDFRPDYRQIVEVRKRFPKAVCLALTATATQRVREDIKTTLGFSGSNEFIASFNRENLFIEVRRKKDPAGQAIQFLQGFPNQSGIIYCFSRKQVDDLASLLQRKGFSVRPYHAGLTDEQRKQNQELFIRDDVQIIVATIAFGMGINKPNVRFVLHYDLPKSIEGYYQEIGRAGRDGLRAHCLLLYGYGDFIKLKSFIDQKEETEQQVALQHLQALKRFAESDTCRRVPLLAYFGEKFSTQNCGMCDVCAGSSLASNAEAESATQRQADITILAQKFLSCVVRTGQRYGATYISHVLLGLEDEKIHNNGHQNLSTFGIGKELSRKQWLNMARQLVQLGLLAKDAEFASLRLTPRGHEVLKSRETITGMLDLETPKQGAPDKYDQELFELLRQKRKDLADTAGVPPYVIFSDRTLIEMAAYYPMTPASLTKIFGVGTVKASRFGDMFLALIREYCQPRHLSEQPKQAVTQSKPEAPKSLGARFIEVGEAFNAGESIASLIERYAVQMGTILNHLYVFAAQGHPLRQDETMLSYSMLPPDLRQAVLTAFKDTGVELLKPVFDRLNGEVSYEELKLLRVYFLSLQDHL
jgi:ATP-dependent DNA helicase RecQ